LIQSKFQRYSWAIDCVVKNNQSQCAARRKSANRNLTRPKSSNCKPSHKSFHVRGGYKKNITLKAVFSAPIIPSDICTKFVYQRTVEIGKVCCHERCQCVVVVLPRMLSLRCYENCHHVVANVAICGGKILKAR
jgi:hypothetical protein